MNFIENIVEKEIIYTHQKFYQNKRKTISDALSFFENQTPFWDEMVGANTSFIKLIFLMQKTIPQLF